MKEKMLPPIQYHLLFCLLQLTENAGASLRIRLNLMADMVGDIDALGITSSKVKKKQKQFDADIKEVTEDIQFLRSKYQPYLEFSFEYEYGTYGDFEAAYDAIYTAMKKIITRYAILGSIRPESMDLVGPSYAKLNGGD